MKLPLKHIGQGDVVDADDHDICSVYLREDYIADESARRIVACVNACAGFSTAFLESTARGHVPSAQSVEASFAHSHGVPGAIEQGEPL